MMWLLSFLPDWIFYLILIVGVLAIIAGEFLKMIPFISQHGQIIRVSGIALTVIGIWFHGNIAANNRWEAKVAELELKVANAEKAAAEANAKIEYVYVDRIKVIEKIKYEVIGSIKENSSELDANCKITPKAVDILNRAAQEIKEGKQ